MANDWCPARREGADGVNHWHVWQWVYVPQVAHIVRYDPQRAAAATSYADAGGKLVGRCIYCGATWEEPSDRDAEA